VVCWGDDASGQASAPPGNFSHVVAGRIHSCGRHLDGTVECWGDDSAGQSSPPSGSFAQITARNTNTCGLRANGDIECWGDLTDPALDCDVDLCGDGTLEAGEDCDDGDNDYVVGEYCHSTCIAVPCGQPANPTAAQPLASDALVVLNAAVGIVVCDLRVCDAVSPSGVTATDSLALLRVAVGISIPLDCPTELP
jgi:hypothetical protein